MKKYILVSFLAIVFGTAGVSVAQAGILQGNTAENLTDNVEVVQSGAGFDGTLTLGRILGIAIRGFLGLLGMIFIILMLVAGYNWMTAAGDEEKIKKAAATIRSAIIGLIIIVAAYAITYFVFAALDGGGGGQFIP